MTDPKDSHDVAAARVLRRLAEAGGLELVSARGVSSLTNPLSILLLKLEQPERAAKIADFLVEQDEVADLFASDEELEQIIRQEWDSVATAAEEQRGPAELEARDEQLEARIAADPDSVDLQLVYSDWLQERGDPLGELIARRSRPPSSRASSAGAPSRRTCGSMGSTSSTSASTCRRAPMCRRSASTTMTTTATTRTATTRSASRPMLFGER